MKADGGVQDARACGAPEPVQPERVDSMVQINMATREITMKVVYYGPALSGKTTNLQQLHVLMNSQSRSEMVTLDTRDDRTLYFDFLPIEFEAVGGFSVKMKLFTVPGQVMHKSTRKVVLAGADAICFVADSQRSSASANAYSWRDMEANLKQNGIDFERLPKVVQFNKRDFPDVKPLAEIKEQWGNIPTFPAVAVRGEGVLETFRELIRGLYRSLNERHDFSAKFGVSEEDFLKGVLRKFPGSERPAS
jgi:signal recognition particle receptor subunit beta